MASPAADRPWMPGYGVPEDTAGLLPWSWAVARLTASRNYWVGTVDASGAPNAAVVWGVWSDEAFFFSTAGASRKARNLRAEPRCTVAPETTADALVVSGRAIAVPGGPDVDRVREAYVAKYGEGFPDPGGDPLFCVHPELVLATPEADFTNRPTRWRFPSP
jgi:hypothetical protein